MTIENSNLPSETRGTPFYDDWVSRYFELGSVNKVISRYSLEGVSFAELHRQLNQRGIVKLSGPNTGMKHAFFLLWEIVNNKLPVESVYRSMPASLQERLSVETLHRIWQNLAFTDTPEEKVRRFGTMLVIHPEDDDSTVLVGRDISPPNDRYGKRIGAWTFPMGFSAKRNPRLGALRIFQQEVATRLAVRGLLSPEGSLSRAVLPDNVEPFMRLNIADIRVNAVGVALPSDLQNTGDFDSFKLTDYQWVHISQLSREAPDDPLYRSGVVDVACEYHNMLFSREAMSLVNRNSTLNVQLQQAFSL